MYKPKETESELIIYQKYIDLVEYGYNLLIKYPKTEKYISWKRFYKKYFICK